MKLFIVLALVALVGCSLVEGRAIRDAKSDLIAKGNELVTSAEAAITKLEADKKTQGANRLKTEEAHLKKLIADLTAATATAQVTRLEAELNMVERRIQMEITRANGEQPTGPTPVTTAPVVPETPSKRDLKSDLITKGTDLATQAETAITKLEADKKTQAATVIKAEEARIKKLVADLTAATETAAITRLERELGALEARLAHELTRINQTGPGPVVGPTPAPTAPETPSKRDLKSDLITKGTDLATQAETAITKLEADKKTQAATVIKAEEARIKKLVADLTAATETAAITRLERELGALEARLAHEFTRINQTGPGPVVGPTPAPANPEPASPSKRDAKSDLIAKGNELVTSAEAAITKLTADMKTQEANRLKTEEAHLKKVIADLTAATAAAQVTRLEQELQMIERRIQMEITRANGTQPAGPTPTPATTD